MCNQKLYSAKYYDLVQRIFFYKIFQLFFEPGLLWNLKQLLPKRHPSIFLKNDKKCILENIFPFILKKYYTILIVNIKYITYQYIRAIVVGKMCACVYEKNGGEGPTYLRDLSQYNISVAKQVCNHKVLHKQFQSTKFYQFQQRMQTNKILVYKIFKIFFFFFLFFFFFFFFKSSNLNDVTQKETQPHSSSQNIYIPQSLRSLIQLKKDDTICNVKNWHQIKCRAARNKLSIQKQTLRTQ
eukprot:TRINITY_DN6918_c0_g1_i13.p1 TRINITY_DN6918_c0_g1~~TRINITY_DN6918_c0_g1_i13.p1  ORF type:complete len:240 (+),score=-19.51 TRINITY_DN6918_c0_g1_i13:656-1375(+)